MNYKQALEASKHNPAGVMKVLEGLEWECSVCNGSGIGVVDSDGRVDVTRICPICDGTGKVHYSWTPQVGEWCIAHDEVCLITKLYSDGGLRLDKSPFREYLSECIPILEWEKIERILEKAGIGFDWFYPANGVEIEMWWVEDNPNQDPCVICKLTGKETRQEAVMKAVIALR